MTVKVASEWLNACSGCEISILDMGERLLQVLEIAEFVHIPALMDHKYFGQLGDGKHIDIPEADVGIISGGIRNEEHLEVAREMRKKCGGHYRPRHLRHPRRHSGSVEFLQQRGNSWTGITPRKPRIR